MQAHGLRLYRDRSRLYSRKLKDVVYEVVHARGIPAYNGEHAAIVRRVVNRAVFQGLYESEDGRQRRAQLVRDVGEKFLTHALKPFQPRDVEEDAERKALLAS